MMSCNLDQIKLQFRKMPQIAIIWATWKVQNKIRVILNFKPILSATLLFTPLTGINPPDCHFFIGLRAVLFFSKLPQYIKKIVLMRRILMCYGPLSRKCCIDFKFNSSLTFLGL